MNKLSQKGAIDLHILMVVLVVVLAGGFLTYRVVSSSDNQTSTESANGDNLATDANSDAESLEGAENVDEDDEETTDGDTEQQNDESSTPAPTPTSPGVTEVNFTKGGGPDISGVNVNASATMASSHSGTCTFTFTNGNTNVVKTSSVNNGKTCEISVPVSEFPKSGTYSLLIEFESNDGLTIASIDGSTVSLVPAEFNFTKGGGDYDGTNVVISETSAAAHTGTCNYLFTLGNSRVEKSSTINNSRTCSITIPGSAFPKSGNWDYTLTFNGTTDYVVGNGGGWAIEIN